MRTVLLLLLGALLVGCGPTRAAAPAPSGPAASVDSAAAADRLLAPRARAGLPADRAAVTAAYAAFWTTVYGLDDRPTDRWPSLLAAVTADPLLPRLLDGMLTQRRAGIREYGSVVTRPVTVQVRGAVATLLDCQDASRAGEAYVDSGLPTTVGQARTPYAAALRLGPDGRWRVTEARQLDTIC